MIKENLVAIKANLPESVGLVAVSKFHPSSDLIEAYNAGQRAFGENRVQEMVKKEEELRSTCPDLEWHFIGTLQRNKVKYIVPFVHIIESVSSIKLLDEIEKQAAKIDRKIDVLLEAHVADEETKTGFDIDELIEAAHLIVETDRYPHISPCGVMGMATLTDNEDRIREDFIQIRKLFEKLKEELFKDNDKFCQISMGMSGDYKLAIQEGSTSVRIGTAIFGPRVY